MNFPAGDVPLVLLPVRLETRFGADALRVRIFPDDVHVTQHQIGLSAAEIESGVRYFQAGATGTALSEMEQAIGAGRALWVIQTLQPYRTWLERGKIGAAPLPAASAGIPPVRAIGLPERFRVVGYINEEKVLEADGAPIAGEPRVLPQERTSAGLPFDAETRWLHDFAAAERAGLGLSIPLGPRAAQIRANGLSRLIVYGLANQTPEQGANALSGLLTAHHFDRGTDFVPVGMPTNHPNEESSLPAVSGSGRAGVLAAALGVAPQVLDWSLKGGDEEGEARALQIALWPGTLGAYLGQWMGLATEELSWVEEHAKAFLRPLGPLPAVRIGRQPYGVLPITVSAALTGKSSAEVGLLSLLQKLRSRPFAVAMSQLSQLEGGTSGVLDALARTAVTPNFSVRPLFGRWFLRNFYQLLRRAPKVPNSTTLVEGDIANAWGSDALLRSITPPLPWTADPDAEFKWLDERRAKGLSGYAALGLPGVPELASAVYSNKTAAAPSTVETDEDPFFNQLLTAGLADIKAAQPSSMLGRLLRLSGLRLALDLAQSAQGASFAEEEWLSTSPLAALPAVEAHPKWVNWLQAARTCAAMAPAQRSLAWRASFDALSHRLDAWMTSLASRKLAHIRAKRPQGTVIGAFGWVENLKPDSAAPASGFIHAPTPRHAATAALLAAGYRAHRAEGNAFQIDLSSARVRRALDVMESAQAGRAVGEVLGEQLERRLIDLGKGSVIATLRTQAPSTTRSPQVDGVKLVEHYRTGVLGNRATIRLGVFIDQLGGDRAPLLDHKGTWRLSLTADRRMSFAWLNPVSGVMEEVLSEGNAPAGAWTQLTIVRDGPAIRFFVDATPAGESALAASQPFAAPSELLELGGGGFAGQIRDVRIWSRALASELLDAAAEINVTGLIASWPLDDAASGVCRDIVGRRDGLLMGGCTAGAAASAQFNGGMIQIGGSRDLRLGWLPAVEGVDLDPVVLKEIDRIADATDAMADLVLAESIHQWADCRLDRAGALVRAFEDGRSWPVKFDVLADRPERRSVIHRVAILGGAVPSAMSEATSLRARLSPALEGFAASLLGSSLSFTVQARFFDASGAELGVEKKSLAALKLSSLDLVFGATANGAAWQGELASVLIHLLFEARAPARKPAVRAELQWTAELDQLLSAAAAVWRVLTVARPLRAADVTWPPQAQADEAPETIAAAEALQKSLTSNLSRIATLLSASAWSSDERNTMRAVLFEAWGAGAKNIVAAPNADEAALRALGKRAAEDISRRLELAGAEKEANERFSILAGNSLKHVPALGLTGPAAKVLDGARFSDAAALTETRRWFRQAARVRAPAQALSDALLCAAALGGEPPSRWDCLHLPRSGEENERWIGVHTGSAAQLSVIALRAKGLTWAKAKHGLLLDSWAEQLPAASQATGVTFHYDAPGAVPPQALLVAVSPTEERPWDAELIANVVNEALNLGKLRGVMWADVPQLHHYLPAMLIPHNVSQDSLSAEP